MTALDERVVKLARFIKYWATRRCINNRAQGTLSSYTLILQVFYFLQNRTVPILPKFMEIELDSNDDRRLFITDSNDIYKKCGYLGQNNETITQLVFDFFRFYSDKQFQGGRKGATVDLYTNTVVDNTLGVLVMKCPITGKNVNPFTIRMWQSIYREFRRVNEYISQERPVSQICQKADLPPLEREAEVKRYHTLLLKQLVAHVNSMKPAPKATAALRWT
uniref:PAP-associated domain-containing protein n=2 Tax=Babesia bovis TaxID=5865 RepID=A7AR90_BABBO|eukprot:XP_001610627.1 hypothetical protein [Babesia bovis T2Bo]